MAGTITHRWDGTTLIVTSDSGTSSANLVGPTGVRGPQGEPGLVIDDNYCKKTETYTKAELDMALETQEEKLKAYVDTNIPTGVVTSEELQLVLNDQMETVEQEIDLAVNPVIEKNKHQDSSIAANAAQIEDIRNRYATKVYVDNKVSGLTPGGGGSNNVVAFGNIWGTGGECFIPLTSGMRVIGSEYVDYVYQGEDLFQYLDLSQDYSLKLYGFSSVYASVGAFEQEITNSKGLWAEIDIIGDKKDWDMPSCTAYVRIYKLVEEGM